MRHHHTTNFFITKMLSVKNFLLKICLAFFISSYSFFAAYGNNFIANSSSGAVGGPASNKAAQAQSQASNPASPNSVNLPPRNLNTQNLNTQNNVKPPSNNLPANGDKHDNTRGRVVLAGDIWCPFNCAADSTQEGVLIEIARKAFERNNIDVVYVVKPWVEAINDLVSGKIDGLLGASDTEIQGAILPSIEQASTKIGVYTLKDSPWVYDGIGSLKSKILGLVDGYTYPDDLKTYINSHYITSPQNFVYATTNNPVKENISDLINKKTTVYIEDENVLANSIDPTTLNEIRNAGYLTLSPVKIYIVFHKSNPRAPDLAKMITDLTFEYKINGNLSNLYSKYNIKEY